jgi:hypothetical protein
MYNDIKSKEEMKHSKPNEENNRRIKYSYVFNPVSLRNFDEIIKQPNVESNARLFINVVKSLMINILLKITISLIGLFMIKHRVKNKVITVKIPVSLIK